MHISSRALCVLTASLLSSTVQAQSTYTFAKVEAPDAFYTLATSINNHGTIVGSYDLQGTIHWFIERDGELEDVVLPVEAQDFSVVALNDHEDIIGRYTDSAGQSHGYFLRADGEWTDLDVPNPEAVDTQPLALNNRGDIVGVYSDADQSEHPFLYRRGSFQDLELSIPGASGVRPTGIGGHGVIVGYYYTVDGQLHGFVRSRGRDTTFDEPGTNGAIPEGISESGLIVGRATTSGQDTPMPVQHAFIYDRGTFTDLVPSFPDQPGRPIIYSEGLDANDHGVVLGQSTPARGDVRLSWVATPDDGD